MFFSSVMEENGLNRAIEESKNEELFILKKNWGMEDLEKAKKL